MFSTPLLVVGLALLVIGQKKKQRKLIFIALACFLFSIGMNDFVRGLVDGWN